MIINGERKLATIERIDSIEPIPGADKIVCATVKGWKVVVQKDEFKTGDLCIYCEVDSILPNDPDTWPEFQFLADKKFRIKTIKLKKQVSQGICFPISILKKKHKLGDDVTSELGIIKHESGAVSESLSKKKTITSVVKTFLWSVLKRNSITRQIFMPLFLTKNTNLSFPTYIIPKTDEERIQNCLGVLNECNNVDIYATIKLDGQSGTYYYHNFHYGVCSRERELGEKECTWRYISKRYGLRSKLKELSNKYGVALAIQGEVCGPGIQENKMGLDDVDFYVFNVWNITHRTYTTWNCVQTISEELGLKTVPLIKLPVTDFTNTDTSLNVLKNYVNTLKYGNGTPAEGMVIRAKDMRYSKTLRGVLSFKIISETFLLEYGE